jgi:regulator of ribonuclease activity B
LAGDGHDLSIPREVDFAVIFPTEDAASSFAVHLLKNDLKVSLHIESARGYPTSER